MTLEGGRGWRCLCCGKEFGTRSSCRRHVETLHYATPSQDCQLCGKILKNKNSHQNHMIMVHGHKKRMWWLQQSCFCANLLFNKLKVVSMFQSSLWLKPDNMAVWGLRAPEKNPNRVFKKFDAFLWSEHYSFTFVYFHSAWLSENRW